ncbi:MAG TPA: class I SAM-dependent methyltransferase [Bacteroidales bacterium]|nr:class I SAM-dependent methyltransferase [Bacteroidales bacterium]
MNLLTPEPWTDYELIDSGKLEKLERFGKYILARPEPQAVWEKSMPDEEWKNLADARFIRKKGTEPRAEPIDKGEWTRKKDMPEQWKISYHYAGMSLHFRLGLTSFGHIGVFPEQSVNWNFIYDRVKSTPSGRVLNLFAYTGGASLAARAAGAEVIHVDSVKPVITWARENMEASGLKDIHWVAEDALKFTRREVKRGSRYQGIILDPPAYGRGPEGEKWLLQESVSEMIAHCSRLLDPGGFLVFSLYSMGYSALIAENLVLSAFGGWRELSSGEIYFPDRKGRKLPLGTYLRAVIK